MEEIQVYALGRKLHRAKRPVTPGNRADRVGDELATTSDQWSRRIEVATDLPLMQREVLEKAAG